jgi:hypothetical protein
VSITNFCVAVALKRWEFQRFTNVSEIDGVRRAVYPSKKLLNLTVASLMEKYKIPLLDEWEGQSAMAIDGGLIESGIALMVPFSVRSMWE